MIFQSVGIEKKKLPPFTPMMNSRMGNIIRAIKTECLDKIIFTYEWQLRFAVKEDLEYWNHYRPHAGLDGRMVLPYPQTKDFIPRWSVSRLSPSEASSVIPHNPLHNAPGGEGQPHGNACPDFGKTRHRKPF